MNAQTIRKQPRLTLRLTSGGLSFSVVDPTTEEQINYEPYIMKSGISQAANLRAALSTAVLPGDDYQNALVVTDSPVLLVPIDEYNKDGQAELYHHSFPVEAGEIAPVVESSVIPQLNVVALFAINRDVKTVTEDHFRDVRYSHVCLPVWKHLYHRSFTGQRQKLYGYFFDGKVCCFSFNQNRMRLVNTFNVNNASNAAYYILNVWKQLTMDQQRDELHLVGMMPEADQFIEGLKKFLQNVYVINPTAEFNRAPITQVNGIPYDIITMYVKS